MEEELNDVYLCFIRLIGEENDGYYRYEFIFTDNPDEVWGEDWEHKPIGLINNPIPSDDYLTEIHIVKRDRHFPDGICRCGNSARTEYDSCSRFVS